jgi:hypothetical protein
MFKNYLKIALRNILRYKGYSFINITDFSIIIQGVCSIRGACQSCSLAHWILYNDQLAPEFCLPNSPGNRNIYPIWADSLDHRIGNG